MIDKVMRAKNLQATVATGNINAQNKTNILQ